MPTTKQKRCPQCSEKIISTAKKCKHCKSILDKSLNKKANKERQGLFMRILNIGCGAIIVIGVSVITIMIIAYIVST